jgi:hypothetical protein
MFTPYRKLSPTVWRRRWEQLFVSHKKKSFKVMNTRFGSQANQQRRSQPK